MAFTTLTGVRLQIPARGDRNWDQVMFNVTWTNIASHDHSGDPKGNQLSTAAFANDSITGAKIRLDNAQWLRARNAANSADLNLIRASATDSAEIGLSLAVTGSVSATTKMNIAPAGGSLASNGDIIFSSTAWQYRVNSVNRTVVNTDESQVLTNKDVDGGTASNTSRITVPKDTLTNLQALTRKQGTLVYGSDTNKLYVDNGSLLNEVGSGTASGAINYLPQNGLAWNFEDNLSTGWSTYANTTPAATPEVSPGGTPSGSFTFTVSSSSPLRLTRSAVITKPASNVQGTGVRTNAFTIDQTDTNKQLTLSFDFDSTAAGYASGDIGIFIIDVTNSTVITPSITALPSGKGTFAAQFVTTSSTSYRLVFHVTTTNATAYTVKIDTISVSPQLTILGAAISDFVSYTAIITNLPVSAQQTFWRRVGSNIEIAGSVTASGAATGTISISMPSGISIDTTYFANGENVSGSTRAVISAVQYNGTIRFVNGTPTVMRFLVNGSANDYNATVPATWANGSLLSFYGSFPVVGWSSNISLATSRDEFAFNTGTTTTANGSDTTSFGYGPQGVNFNAIASNVSTASVTTYRCRFVTPIQPTDVIAIEIQRPSDNKWFPVFSDCFNFQILNSSFYGMQFVRVSNSNTDIDVSFGNAGAKPYNCATYGAANGDPWSGYTSYKWRVRKSSSPLVNQLSGAIVGVQDNSDALAGYLGEYVDSGAITTVSSGVSTAYANITSITLGAGDWFVTGTARTELNTGTGVTRNIFAISTNSANTTTDHVPGYNQLETPPPTATVDGSCSISNYRVKVAAGTTQTIYWKFRMDYSGGAPRVNGARLFATRRR